MRRRLPILIAAFLLSGVCAVVAETVASVKSATDVPTHVTIQKITKMAATGKVASIDDSTIKIERTVKGNMETMELGFEKPIQDTKIGDKVRINYVEKGGKYTVTKITKIAKKSKTPVIHHQGRDITKQGPDAQLGK
jgi:Cu/Ag efflux protein CusF